eukprot:TRINITY_DN1098_c0_g1_i1.p1 TRINITY_DN1098_c0_g1~~TRINITY_DN1098_c0_g1_i1.p1  ORF type:complete len:308 (+),score=139.34 TRINITY_DN1098_c0_g1_i1:67-924(+)
MATEGGQNTVLLKVEGPVATITLNRPERGNSITLSMREEFLRALASVEKTPEVRVLVLTGSGKFFCTGMDLRAPDQEDLRARVDTETAAFQTLKMFEKLKNFKKPVIAKLNGSALGGGVGLVFAADYRVSLRSNFVSFPEVQRGLLPALISAIIVPQLGLFQSKQLMMSGQKVSADRLYELGQLTKVVEDSAALDAAVAEIVKQLLSCAPGAVSETKAICHFVSNHSFDENVSHVRQVFNEMLNSDEAVFGITNFAQKKTPDWDAFVREQQKHKRQELEAPRARL